MAKLEPRKLMEQAIAVMLQSVAEPRADGRANPLVGAVLWKPDGTVETAYRGELRDGDHAEYALLERKNRDKKLDGAALFATLEPCAPGSRRHPKLGCAEWIVLARIKEAWIGIEDPDPTVDRKGIRYLQDSGVTVHMFDRDLQSMKKRAQQAGLPLPKYTWEDPYLVLTLFRSPAGAVRGLSPDMLDRLNDDEKASWQFIVGRESVTSPVLVEQMGFDERKAQRVLKKLLDAGLLRRVGRGPATRYEVVR